MKFKPLTENQIIISVDRLTRFKPTEEKYIRVFKDIIVSNLIEPKYKKNELLNISYDKMRDIVVEIFNSSFESDNTYDLSLNKKLKDYENNIFRNNEEVNKLLDNKLDYISALEFISKKKDIPINLKWLIELNKSSDVIVSRQEKKLQYPLEAIVIVEGITEEILLPEFASILDFDFMKYGIKVIPAGGKNQVVKLYYSLSEQLKLPIFVLLDKDAVDNVNSINNKLRTIDKVYLLNSGEFEDLLPTSLIVKAINLHLKNFASVNIVDITKPEPMVHILEEFFKEHGIHEFKKAEFAHIVQTQIKSEADVSDEIRYIINNIKNLLHVFC